MEDSTNITPSTKPVDSYKKEASDEIDIKDIILQLWKVRKFIIIFTGIFFLIGIFIAFTSPVKYTASCTVLPQTGENSGNNMGGFVSMMGINIGSGMSSETLSPSVYPQILKSVPFCKEVMNTLITTKKSPYTPITLYEYYTNKKYQDKSLAASTIIAAVNSSKKNTYPTVYTDTLSNQIITLTINEQKVINAIRKNTHFESNTKEGYIKLGYTFVESQAVAQITESLFTTLEKYVINYKAQKEIDNLQFVQTSYDEAHKDIIQKQANLAAFQDANRGLVTATARSTERQLMSEYDMAFTIYSELAKQLEQAKLAVKASTPVLTVIDPVIVPQQKSAPKRSMIITIALLLGLMIATTWVLVKPFFKDISKDIKQDKKL